MSWKYFDNSISGHMQSGGGNWLIDWWMVCGSNGRVKEWSRSGSCSGSSSGAGAGDWFVAASCLVAYEWEMCAWLMSSSLSSLRWQAKLEEEAPWRGLLLCLLSGVYDMRNTMPRAEPASVTRLATQRQRYPATHIDTCHLPHATYRTLPSDVSAIWWRFSTGGGLIRPMKNEAQSRAWSAAKQNQIFCFAKKGKTKFINWVKSLEDSPWQREQVPHAAWPWHWHAASSGGGLITRLPSLK